MASWRQMYFHLFNAISDALRKMETQDNDSAAETLIAARQWGENAFMDMSEEETNTG